MYFKSIYQAQVLNPLVFFIKTLFVTKIYLKNYIKQMMLWNLVTLNLKLPDIINHCPVFCHVQLKYSCSDNTEFFEFQDNLDYLSGSYRFFHRNVITLICWNLIFRVPWFSKLWSWSRALNYRIKILNKIRKLSREMTSSVLKIPSHLVR